MWVRLSALCVFVGCYSPQLQSGVPCAANGSCPGTTTCVLVEGDPLCLDQPGADAGSAGLDAVVDGAMPVDSQSVDSQPVDAPVAVPPWMLVQTTGHFGATATVAATGAGNLIVVGIETGATNTVTAVTDNAGNVYTPIERAINSVGGFGVELWSATNSNPGATTITATASTVFATVAWEVDGIRTTGALDTSSKVDNQPSSTTPFGASITTSAAGSLVISVVIVDNTVSGIHAGSPFTNDHKTFGNGWAHLTDPAAPAGAYRAQWDQAISGISCAASAAFLAGP